MKNIVILKGGTYRQNLFKDQLGLIRDRIDDTAQLDFHNGSGGTILLYRNSEGEIVLSTGVGEEPMEVKMDLSFVNEDPEFYLLATVIDKSVYGDSMYVTPEQIVRFIKVLYLDTKTNRVCYLDTKEPVNEVTTHLVPLATVNRLPDTPVYTAAINTDVIFIVNELYESDDKTIVREVWGIDSSTQTISDMLFNPMLSGNLKLVNNVYFVTGDKFTVRLGDSAALLGTELNFSNPLVKIDCTLPYDVSEDGSYLTLNTKDFPKDGYHYLTFGLDYYRPLRPYMSNPKDLPVVELLFVIK